MASLKTTIDMSGVVRCGVGAKIYDSMEITSPDKIRFGAPMVQLKDGKIVINKGELVRILRMVNDLPEELYDREVVIE